MADESDDTSESEAEPSSDASDAPEADSEKEEPKQKQEKQEKREKTPLWKRRFALPLLIYVICTSVYLGTLGKRFGETSPDNHYAHLADSWLAGQLHHQGHPPGNNDWACYDTQEKDLCPNNRFRFGDQERYLWYVSFPPFPAAVILPAVAIFGVDVSDYLFWALLAGLGPALLFMLLRMLRENGRSGRTLKEDLMLTALFAFGSVFYFVAVQGTVWFAAHVVCIPLLILYVHFGLDARRPVLAGLMLGCAFLTRPTTALLFPFMAFEILKAVHDGATVDQDAWYRRIKPWLAGVDWKRAFRIGMLFAAPILVCGAIAMWMNDARFDDPFEFGHTYLQIRWRPRIERWGLFNYHYFSKNLAVFAASTPWLSAHPPYLTISRHGLALWVTTPAILWALWPKKTTLTTWGLWAAVIPVALLNLCYQNSGWAQFGYRFALDYLPLVFVLIALGQRRFRIGFVVLLLWSIAINTFGAATFLRAEQYYDQDQTQDRMFQPDRVP